MSEIKIKQEKIVQKKKKKGPIKLAIRFALKKMGIWIMNALMSSTRNPTPPLRKHPCIVAIWHEELPGIICHLTGEPNYVTLVSSSSIGDVTTGVIQGRGPFVYRGSTKQPSLTSIIRIIKDLRSGYSFLNAVDGPRGPRREFKAGTTTIAKKTGVPIYCVRFFYKGFRVPSWDRMLVPYPFASVTAKWSDPIYVKEGDDELEKMRLCENIMLEMGENK